MNRTRRGVPPLAGVMPLLDALAAAGVAVGVVTNAPRRAAAHTLTAAGFVGCFSVVVVADEVARPKPDPAPYVAGCRAVGVKAGEVRSFDGGGGGVWRRGRRGKGGGVGSGGRGKSGVRTCQGGAAWRESVSCEGVGCMAGKSTLRRCGVNGVHLPWGRGEGGGGGVEWKGGSACLV